MNYLQEVVGHYRKVPPENLVDTCVLINFLKEETSKEKKREIADMLKKSFNISIITKLEFLSHNQLTKDEEAFINVARTVPLYDKVFDTAARLRREFKLKTSDSLIAATAIEENYMLVTSDKKDFEKIKELDVKFI